jgi:P4 family phage/plasmid primase-like protien
MDKTKQQFLSFFPNAKFRYLDLTGNNRLPISSNEKRNDLNAQGYCAFFTPNGFEGDTATKDKCINLNSFFIDIDKKLTKEEIENVKTILEPTFIIQTFNGFHFYWLLDETIYKDEVENWDEIVAKWEEIEQNIVNTIPNADKAVKDVPRILRMPDQFYWKKTENLYKQSSPRVFTVKGVHKNVACRYSFNQMEEAFPTAQSLEVKPNLLPEKAKSISDSEKKAFFDKVNELYPIEERPSFQRLIGAHPDSLPREGCRNLALVITGTLMRQAGWTYEQSLKQINKVGWHGVEKERGGEQEIMNTLASAFRTNYTYSHKNEIISHNMSGEESAKMQDIFSGIMKERREVDKIRFGTYERDLLAQHPYLKKNEIGIIYEYRDGVYKMLSDQDISDMVLTGLYEDLLWGYRTKRNVSDKVACLLSIIPKLEITNDLGYWINVKNGLLNIYTKELKPHTPSFVSLIQYPVEYDPKAKCPIWDSCMADWMSGPEQEEKTTLLKQFCGYTLTSSMQHDKALFMVGDGGNGKSTFIDTISMIIGREGTSHIDLESLYGQFGMAGLMGKRLNVIEEVRGNYYESNKLKKLISGETVTIDMKYKDQFTFRPQAKFVFSVNLLPRVDDTSTGTERRICAVHFRNNYRLNPNTELRSSFGLLAKELSGILNWMIEGANDLSEKKNFIITNEQTRMMNEYREENSSVEGFLSQCIEVEVGYEISVPDLYSEYKKWCDSDGGRKKKANITFTKEVTAFGIKGERFTYSPRLSGHEDAKFNGIKLSPHWTAQKDKANNW